MINTRQDGMVQVKQRRMEGRLIRHQIFLQYFTGKQRFVNLHYDTWLMDTFRNKENLHLLLQPHRHPSTDDWQLNTCLRRKIIPPHERKSSFSTLLYMALFIACSPEFWACLHTKATAYYARGKRYKNDHFISCRNFQKTNTTQIHSPKYTTIWFLGRSAAEGLIKNTLLFFLGASNNTRDALVIKPPHPVIWKTVIGNSFEHSLGSGYTYSETYAHADERRFPRLILQCMVYEESCLWLRIIDGLPNLRLMSSWGCCRARITKSSFFEADNENNFPQFPAHRSRQCVRGCFVSLSRCSLYQC